MVQAPGVPGYSVIQQQGYICGHICVMWTVLLHVCFFNITMTKQNEFHLYLTAVSSELLFTLKGLVWIRVLDTRKLCSVNTLHFLFGYCWILKISVRRFSYFPAGGTKPHWLRSNSKKSQVWASHTPSLSFSFFC